MADAMAVAVSIAFVVLVAVAMGKPLVHALRVGSQPADQPESPALRLEEPPQDDEGSVGVREPRRPIPSGSAGEVALELEAPENEVNVSSTPLVNSSVSESRSVREDRAA